MGKLVALFIVVIADTKQICITALESRYKIKYLSTYANPRVSVFPSVIVIQIYSNREELVL